MSDIIPFAVFSFFFSKKNSFLARASWYAFVRGCSHHRKWHVHRSRNCYEFGNWLQQHRPVEFGKFTFLALTIFGLGETLGFILFPIFTRCLCFPLICVNYVVFPFVSARFIYLSLSECNTIWLGLHTDVYISMYISSSCVNRMYACLPM